MLLFTHNVKNIKGTAYPSHTYFARQRNICYGDGDDDGDGVARCERAFKSPTKSFKAHSR